MSKQGLIVEFALPGPRKKREEMPAPKGPVPRIARLLALAHKWEGMVRRGEVADYAQIARRMGLSRARVTQICSLSLLAPEIQDAVLVSSSNQDIPERSLRRTSSKVKWSRQRDSGASGPSRTLSWSPSGKAARGWSTPCRRRWESEASSLDETTCRSSLRRRTRRLLRERRGGLLMP